MQPSDLSKTRFYFQQPHQRTGSVSLRACRILTLLNVVKSERITHAHFQRPQCRRIERELADFAFDCYYGAGIGFNEMSHILLRRPLVLSGTFGRCRLGKQASKSP